MSAMKRNPVLVVILLLVLLGGGYLLLNQRIFELTSDATKAPKAENTKQLSVSPPNDCRGLTPSQTEGPYYKEGSPKTGNLLKDGPTGEKIVITGYVFDRDCKPAGGAWLDFWQADGKGSYANDSYKLRGHQFTNDDGKYYLETVVPGEYPGRTPHIHVKVRKSDNSPIITSQLYFPDVIQNQSDSIFDETMLLKVEELNGQKVGYYNFVVN